MDARPARKRRENDDEEPAQFAVTGWIRERQKEFGVSFAQLESIFGRGGLLSKVLAPHYEPRPQQAEMARAVYRTLRDSGVLLVEAPTGVGKSLAYLVPGILRAHETRSPLLVSTFTRTLQDQILGHDLPHLRRIIERPIRAAVLKGRANYLCRNRWASLLDEIRGTSEGEELERALGYWVQTTESGDLAEAPVPKGRLGARIAGALGRIASDARFCGTSDCAPEAGCFFKKSRARAREAHLVIVNHSLLVIDLFSESAGLPEWSAAVIDEAHHLPRVAAGPLSFSSSESSLDGALKGLGGRGEPGLTDQLRRALRGVGGDEARSEILRKLRHFEGETVRYSTLARAFWGELKSSPPFPRGEDRLRYGPTAPVLDLFPASGFDLCSELEAHLRRARRLLDEAGALHEAAARPAPGNPPPERPDPAPLYEAARHADEAEAELGKLSDLLTPDQGQTIYWIEPGGASGAALRAAPLSVGPQLYEALFRRKEAVVLTSATLALEGNFGHLAGKVGLPDDGYEGLILATPFRLETQVAARVVVSTPDPNAPGFHEALADGVRELVLRLRRKTLVLFTAHDSLRRVESALRAPLEERGVRVYAQGVDGSQRAVLDGFLEPGPAVLLGAASFWEGVDFPGEDLEVLIVARLPFLVPKDPMVEAISERLAEEGRDPFREYQLPEALVRFRQGFGRLIRRIGDRGLFVVADPRLTTRGYGRRFRTSAGVEFREAVDWPALAAEAEGWFAGHLPPESC